jgi:AcrR family transcriptional regulator
LATEDWKVSMKSYFGDADLRVRRTHKLLWEALLAELSERDFEAITVTDICERAMVHRTTFYKQYEDKNALLDQGIRQICDAIVAEEEHRPPSAYTAERPPPYFVRLFEHAAQQEQFYRLMLGGHGIGRFQTLVKAYIEDVAAANVRESPSAEPNLAISRAMHAHFVAGAILSLVVWWLENGQPYTPHQMAQYLMSPHGVPPSRS